MGSIIFKTLVGMIAGVAVWAVVEPFKPNYQSSSWGFFELVLMIGWAIALGASVGFLNGYQRGSRSHAIRELVLGMAFAVIGVMIGRGVSTPFAVMMNVPGMLILGRILAIGCIGLGMGAGIGFCTLVPRRGIQGAIGGAIGGSIAGACFDLIGTVTQGITLSAQGVQAGQLGETGGPSRAVTAAVMCGAIALMIGIVEALSKSAWLRLELGRNEGKEWVLDKPVMALGRDERADIPLFGDPNIGPKHAVIQKQGANYVVIDQGSPIGIGVNGQRVQHAVLQPNDVVQLGSLNLRFLMKNVKAPNRGPEPGRAVANPINASTPVQPIQQPIQPMQPVQPVPAQALPPTLVALDGPLTGQRFPLAVAIELGRESMQIPLGFDSSASRRHTRIEAQGGQVVVTDLGSTNGTFLNGQRVTNGIAKMGDIIKVGATSFRIES